ncbi:dimethylsulfonioproprionate lyase family protein [Ancylobacter lacus]|uniref:dimethylsulfonioproprionate lyase family protein n=1 Tax=Ancylobacter lacus TaxID=2579970 RepID=UPI001BCE50D4|nr:dimethylsulfonioproprionate lyase family protein [Ancylobacter lacus]MBS7538450.1 dimethylsulfoniopropionate lyase [Ancylobacter lacus]
MSPRSDTLQAFLDIALAAFAGHATVAESRRCLAGIEAALATPGSRGGAGGGRLPVCAHLEPALAVAEADPRFAPLVARFRALEPALDWRRRASHDGTASANFVDGHANALIVGPGGLEDRADVWLGASLLAPQVRYPDHDHAPEEVYLVLSEGEFSQGGGAWFTPGIGGSFYNVPSIRHAMRAGATPLLAFWALKAAS